jgi:ferredoxin
MTERQSSPCEWKHYGSRRRHQRSDHGPRGRRSGVRGVSGRKKSLPGRTSGTAESVFSQAVPADLRIWRSISAGSRTTRDQGFHPGRSGEGRRRAGQLHVSVKINPRYVNENCTCCGDCAEACQTEVIDEYNLGMCKTKGAYLPFEMAFPARYVISPQIIGTDDATRSRRPANTMPSIWTCRPRPWTCPSARLSGPPAGSPTMPPRSTTWVSASTTTSSPT